ncbi:Protein of unknown function [Bacillus thuringiensis]|uniref:Uncharacterized protein n=1 Tax=Bacillus thuringiensis TaxID=1428 RepID=A0A1C4DMZ2_BACTU|nr:Protein of unknown function [Bacillus thuringiensis]
MVEGPDYDDS